MVKYVLTKAISRMTVKMPGGIPKLSATSVNIVVGLNLIAMRYCFNSCYCGIRLRLIYHKMLTEQGTEFQNCASFSALKTFAGLVLEHFSSLLRLNSKEIEVRFQIVGSLDSLALS